jgi:membrane protein DedA with SNARE-associated domain
MLIAALATLGFANVFIPPIPIESMALAGGFFAGTGHANPFVFWLACSTGMTLGSAVLYQLAVSQGRRVLDYGFVARQISGEMIERVRGWFDRYGVWAIFLGKCLPGTSFITVLCSGLFGMRRRKALSAISLANSLFFGATVFSGRYLGRDWRRIISLEIQADEVIVAIGLAVVAVGYVLIMWHRSRVAAGHRNENDAVSRSEMTGIRDRQPMD